MYLDEPSISERTKKRRLWCFSLLGLSVIALVLVAIFAPNAELDYIFGQMSWELFLVCVVVVMIMVTAIYYDEKRVSQVYLSSTGMLDTTTPRTYTPMKVNFLSKIFGRVNIFWQRKNLERFKYEDGNISVSNSVGDKVEGPLSNLTFSYKLDKNKATDELYIYQYTISDNKGNSVTFNRHNSLFNDEEYSDMEMLLSLCGTVKEAKQSKYMRKLGDVLEKVKDLDFHNLVSSATDMAVDSASDKVMDKVGQLAKAKLMGEDTKTSSKFRVVMKKICEYGLLVIAVIYVLTVIYINLEPLFSKSDSYSDNADYVEEFKTYGDLDLEEAVPVEPEYNPGWDEFYEISNGQIFLCHFDDGQQFFLSMNDETHSGKYLAPSGKIYILRQVSEELTNQWPEAFEYTIKYSVYKRSLEETKMKFKLKVVYSGEGASLKGTMIGMNGYTYQDFDGYYITDTFAE